MTKRIFTGEFLRENLPDSEVVDYIRALAKDGVPNGRGHISVLGKHLGAFIRLGKGCGGNWRKDLDVGNTREQDRSMVREDFFKIIKDYDSFMKSQALTDEEIEKYGIVAYNTFEQEARTRYPNRAKVPWDAADENIQEIFKLVAKSVKDQSLKDGR